MSDEDNTSNSDVVIDIEELKLNLNLPDDTQLALIELGERFEALNKGFGELLVYMNLVDERIQRLDGEALVTATVQQHVGQDGTARVYRMRPEIPAMDDVRNPRDLVKEGDKSALAKMVISQ